MKTSEDTKSQINLQQIIEGVIFAFIIVLVGFPLCALFEYAIIKIIILTLTFWKRRCVKMIRQIIAGFWILLVVVVLVCLFMQEHC